MSSVTIEMTVEMDGGETWSVVADQRDIAKWEVAPFGGPFTRFEDKAMTGCRFLAWSASKRQGRTQLDWEPFNDACIEAVPVEEEPDGTDEAEDPGRPAR